MYSSQEQQWRVATMHSSWLVVLVLVLVLVEFEMLLVIVC